MIETGTILQNRYRIEKQIGQGGMGKVYVATDERFVSETTFTLRCKSAARIEKINARTNSQVEKSRQRQISRDSQKHHDSEIDSVSPFEAWINFIKIYKFCFNL